jgi:hypothetical protein
LIELIYPVSTNGHSFDGLVLGHQKSVQRRNNAIMAAVAALTGYTLYIVNLLTLFDFLFTNTAHAIIFYNNGLLYINMQGGVHPDNSMNNLMPLP